MNLDKSVLVENLQFIFEDAGWEAVAEYVLDREKQLVYDDAMKRARKRQLKRIEVRLKEARDGLAQNMGEGTAIR